MVAELVAIKPRREPLRELQRPLPISIELV
jgi:hypothetical protein